MTINDTPQTATVSDEAVQVAIDAYSRQMDYNDDDDDALKAAIIAVIPHLALSAAPCSVEVKKLDWTLFNPEKEIWIADSPLGLRSYYAASAENAQNRYESDMRSAIITKPVDVAAVLPDVEEGISLAISLLFAHEEKYHDYEGDNVEGDSLRGIRHHLQGCLIHADEPAAPKSEAGG